MGKQEDSCKLQQDRTDCALTSKTQVRKRTSCTVHAQCLHRYPTSSLSDNAVRSYDGQTYTHSSKLGSCAWNGPKRERQSYWWERMTKQKRNVKKRKFSLRDYVLLKQKNTINGPLHLSQRFTSSLKFKDHQSLSDGLKMDENCVEMQVKLNLQIR